MPLKASAPGSLMLLGEYAVLYGKQALVCAIDQRIQVLLTPRSDKRIILYSSLYGHYETEIAQLKIEKPFHFVLGTLQYYQAKMKQGCDIEIISSFSDTVGLGSSAAVTVATLAALVSWLNIRVTPIELVRQGKAIIRQVQGVGSGADIAASVYGGMVAYQAQPVFVEKLKEIYPLTVLYSGFKTPTVEAIQHVQRKFSTYNILLRHIMNSIGQCAAEGIQCARQAAWQQLGNIMNIQQGMMEALGVNTVLLSEMIADLRQQPSVLGAKISGSGLGDCVVALGSLPKNEIDLHAQSGVQRLFIEMHMQGVQCEKY